MHGAKNVQISRDESNWELEIKAEFPPEILQHYRKEAVRDIGKNAKISGFRPGHIPEAVLVREFGETAILEHAAEHAIQHELPEILAAEKANIVEAPRVSIEKPVSDKPLRFTARAPLAPEIHLPDYKKIAGVRNAKQETVSVSDGEHIETQTHLRRERARIEKVEGGMEPAQAAEEAQKAKIEDLPPLDDEFVKSLGYASAEDFTQKLREHIKNEKELQAKSKHRAELIDDIVRESRVSYPSILREYELDDMEVRMRGDLERMGKTFEEYMSETKKTRDAIRLEWKEAADKRAKIRLILSEIARTERLEPDELALSHEILHAKKHRAHADPNVLRAHIAHAMRNEKVLELLEKLS
ncbi:MAG: trigger factor [Parcubacteria group bacterium Gr01-1014_8]|nr:MAG: trigger factor [Parcubacteria group bacterium Gr01-1014_8]